MAKKLTELFFLSSPLFHISPISWDSNVNSHFHGNWGSCGDSACKEWILYTGEIWGHLFGDNFAIFITWGRNTIRSCMENKYEALRYLCTVIISKKKAITKLDALHNNSIRHCNKCYKLLLHRSFPFPTHRKTRFIIVRMTTKVPILNKVVNPIHNLSFPC